MNDLKPITTDEEHTAAVDEIRAIWDAEPGSAEEDRLDKLSALVDDYERKRWPIEPLSPEEWAIAEREAKGLPIDEPMPSPEAGAFGGIGITMLIDPPNPFSPLAEWQQFLAEMEKALADTNDPALVEEYIARAKEQIADSGIETSSGNAP